MLWLWITGYYYGMQDILPELVIRFISDHYLAGVSRAELGYAYNADEEDAVTGALGQALLTPAPIIISQNGITYSFQTTHRKLRSKGRNVPEKKFGADGIFQLDVFDERGRPLRRKGLLFQCKKHWTRTNQGLLEQTRKMSTYSLDAIVIDFRQDGYRAVSASEVIRAGGDRHKVRHGANLPLSKVLGVDFVECRRGEVGLYWDAEAEALITSRGEFVVRSPIPEHLIATSIQRSS